MDGVGSNPLLPKVKTSRSAGWCGSTDPEMEPSLPDHWPKSTDEEINARPNRVINVGSDQEYLFNSNFVKTSKYEMWTFLPKFLMEEFNPKTKVANCYFLMVASLQCIPAISNTFGYPTTLIPLICVVLVDGIFAAFEDFGRHKADREANSSLVSCFDRTTCSFYDCEWANLQVGDFVKIKSREKIPADMLILGVAEKGPVPQGICYVETKSLDGETNLKIRHALPNICKVVSIIIILLYYLFIMFKSYFYLFSWIVLLTSLIFEVLSLWNIPINS
jgi:magnesium-transporting ATPase (P-type)